MEEKLYNKFLNWRDEKRITFIHTDIELFKDCWEKAYQVGWDEYNIYQKETLAKHWEETIRTEERAKTAKEIFDWLEQKLNENYDSQHILSDINLEISEKKAKYIITPNNPSE